MTDKEPMSEEERHKQMITEACRRTGLSVDEGEWVTDEDGDLVAKLGRWQVIIDDEDRGLFEGEEGELSASVVGAPQHGNEQVKFYFRADDLDFGQEVSPFDDVEPEP